MLRVNKSILLKKAILIFLFISVLLIVIFFYLYYLNSRKQLNLLLISIDTLRPDHMGVYGYEKATTPYIDKWANEATIYQNAYTVAPVTLPSFIALMTGQSPLKTRIVNNRAYSLSDNALTLAELLKEKGYLTTAYVSSEIFLPEMTNLDQGFNEFNLIPYKSNKNVSLKEYREFLSRSTTWMDVNKDKKFFLWLHLMDPHSPYLPEKSLRCKFNNSYCKTLENKDDTTLERDRLHLKGCLSDKLPSSTVGLYETLYDGEIFQADKLVGKILESLKSIGISDNTMVVLYGDHGEGFDHQYYFEHGDTLYDSSIKIPLLIRYPKQYKKSNNVNPINNTDIFFLILKALNVEIPAGGWGEYNKKREYTYSFSQNLTKFSISDGNYKYIYSIDDTCLLDKKQEELYSLIKDKNEVNNIIGKNKNIAGFLKNKLLDYLRPYNLPQKSAKKEKNYDKDAIEYLKSLGY